jgi:hypothetical protein
MMSDDLNRTERRRTGSALSRFVDRWLVFAGAGLAAIALLGALAASIAGVTVGDDLVDQIVVDLMRVSLFWLAIAAFFGWIFVSLRRVFFKPEPPFLRVGAMGLALPPFALASVATFLAERVEWRMFAWTFGLGSLLVATTVAFYILMARRWALLD